MLSPHKPQVKGNDLAEHHDGREDSDHVKEMQKAEVNNRGQEPSPGHQAK